MSVALPARLRDPQTGINHDNPRPKVDLQIRFIDGAWYVYRYAEVSGEWRRRDEVPFETAQLITELAGSITAEVVAKNYRGWCEAKLAWTREHFRRVRRDAEAALLDARRAAEQARRHA